MVILVVNINVRSIAVCQILFCFMCANSVNPYNILSRVNYSYSHFTEEECEAQKIKFLAQGRTAKKGYS